MDRYTHIYIHIFADKYITCVNGRTGEENPTQLYHTAQTIRKKWDKRDQSRRLTNQTIGILKKEKSKIEERKQFRFFFLKEHSKK